MNAFKLAALDSCIILKGLLASARVSIHSLGLPSSAVTLPYNLPLVSVSSSSAFDGSGFSLFCSAIAHSLFHTLSIVLSLSSSLELVNQF
jgi:hypothetical protein